MSSRCHLVYALAPAGVSAREANELLSEYVADRSRGLAVWHHHFAPHLHLRERGRAGLRRSPSPELLRGCLTRR